MHQCIKTVRNDYTSDKFDTNLLKPLKFKFGIGN